RLSWGKKIIRMKRSLLLISVLVLFHWNSFSQASVQIVSESPLQSFSWKRLKTETYPGKQDDITFVDENNGWYVNGYGRIYHTTDGGLNWEKQLQQKGTFFRCIAFLDTLRGFAGTVGTDYFPNVTDTIPLYETRDGGKTWTPVKYEGPYVKGLCALDIVKEPFVNHGVLSYKVHLYGVGRVGAPANMMASHDGGETWSSRSMESHCSMLFDIDMFDKKSGIACAATSEDIEQSHALILKTDDGGVSWRKVYESDRPFELTWKSSFPDASTGFVTIQSYNPDTTVKQQRIAKTLDGGNTWKEIDLVKDAGAREFGVGFLDEKHGFVGTMKSGYETTDGGVTWTAVDLGKACNKIRIYKDASGTAYGYAIGVDVFKGVFE
ncbi:MAG: WD40/YVTN/BNR-like repeat-containing protein, partial [Bacteroidota bacterium]